MYDYTWLVDDLLLLQHFGALWDNICVYVCMCVCARALVCVYVCMYVTTVSMVMKLRDFGSYETKFMIMCAWVVIICC
jgi:hypothetical protein